MRYLLFLILSLAATAISAETTAERGLAIAIEADKRDIGWSDFTAKMLMVLRNKEGQESTRSIKLSSLEVQDDGDKSLSVFDSPRDIKGTAFLSYTHSLKPDDQWLFLPALKRVKRIASANKSGPFVGSEFAYEDLTSQEVEKYTYNWLRDETIDGQTLFVVEATPAYANSGYTRQVVWIDSEMHQPVKIMFYDRKNSLLKTLENTEWKQHLSKYWRPGRMYMKNHQTLKATELIWSDYTFKAGLTDRDFDQSTLKRAR
jgi:hypothetical protein